MSKYEPRNTWDRRFNPKACAEGIYRGMNYGQCSRKGVIEHEGDMWCKAHHPPTVDEKRRASQTKFEAEYKARRDRKNAEYKMARFGPKFIEALTQIAEMRGSSPALLAAKVLKEYEADGEE